MSKRGISLFLLGTVLAGGCLYRVTQNDIRHQNARYLQEMLTGSYSRQEQTYTESFSLKSGNQYHQHLWLGNGKSVDNFGSWSLPTDAPERLSDAQLVLHGVLAPELPGSHGDYEVSARAFHDSQAEANRFH